jgi:hypothetical protein
MSSTAKRPKVTDPAPECHASDTTSVGKITEETSKPQEDAICSEVQEIISSIESDDDIRHVVKNLTKLVKERDTHARLTKKDIDLIINAFKETGRGFDAFIRYLFREISVSDETAPMLVNSAAFSALASHAKKEKHRFPVIPTLDVVYNLSKACNVMDLLKATGLLEELWKCAFNSHREDPFCAHTGFGILCKAASRTSPEVLYEWSDVPARVVRIVLDRVSRVSPDPETFERGMGLVNAMLSSRLWRVHVEDPTILLALTCDAIRKSPESQQRLIQIHREFLERTFDSEGKCNLKFT